MYRITRRVRGLAAFGLLAVVGVPVAATAQPVAAAAPANCVTNVETQKSTCYSTFRAALAAATGGAISDAPLTAQGKVDAPLAARINKAGITASTVVIGIVYFDTNYQTSAGVYTASHGCAEGSTFGVPYVGDVNNDRFRSAQTFNYCYAFHYTDANYAGIVNTIYANDGRPTFDTYLDRQTSSIKWYRGPTRRELLDLCGNGSTSCDFHPQTGLIPSFSGYHEVARVINCSPTQQNRTISWSDTTGGSYTLGVEVGLSSGLSLEGILTFDRSIKFNFQAEWNWSKTYSDSSTIVADPYSWVALDRDPQVQTVSGYFKMRFSSPKWGYTSWNVTDYTGTGPVPQGVSITRIRGAAMTDAERAANCANTTGVKIVRTSA